MRRIGLLSDTHGVIPERLFIFFEKCDEIWHAGDIGNEETLNLLVGERMFRAVHGNIDGQDIRIKYPARLRFLCEGMDILMTHIGGYPGHYDRSVRVEIYTRPPKLFVCGHSHILKVIYDKKLEILHLNPGAAGRTGFHKVCTALRFVIDGTDIREMEIWETERLRDLAGEQLQRT
jgi:putative phosphoesterase